MLRGGENLTSVQDQDHAEGLCCVSGGPYVKEWVRCVIPVIMCGDYRLIFGQSARVANESTIVANVVRSSSSHKICNPMMICAPKVPN